MEWRRCPNFPDYEVSEQGDFRRLTPGRGARVGIILKPFIREDGYPMYMPRRDGETLHVKAHQLVAWAFLGPPPFAGAEVAHDDGDPSHNHWRNLRWDTRSGNHKDKVRHGTDARGEKQAGHKVATAQVVEMRARYRENENLSTDDLAEQFGISQVEALRIITGKRWAHVPGAIKARRRARHGEHNGRARLSRASVVEARKRFATGEPIADLATHFGVGYEQMRRAIRGEAWASIPGAIPAR